MASVWMEFFINIMPNDIRGWIGPRFSRHLSYGWEKVRKKPQPVNVARPRIEPGPPRWKATMVTLDHGGGHGHSLYCCLFCELELFKNVHLVSRTKWGREQGRVAEPAWNTVKDEGKGIPITGHQGPWGMWMQGSTYTVHRCGTGGSSGPG